MENFVIQLLTVTDVLNLFSYIFNLFFRLIRVKHSTPFHLLIDMHTIMKFVTLGHVVFV